MKKNIYLRSIIYAIIILIYRILYLVSAFLKGFGSASNHFAADIILNISFFSLNCLTYWLFFYLIDFRNKIEFWVVSGLTLMIWVVLYFYYN